MPRKPKQFWNTIHSVILGKDGSATIMFYINSAAVDIIKLTPSETDKLRSLLNG